METIQKRVATALAISEKQVEAAITLLDQGATVPFISRYRKEVTGGLDDGQLRQLEERLGYLRSLDERREAILKLIAEQEKLTPQLRQEIEEAESKIRLEDLYLPFKKRRRTKGQIAIEAGIEPLATTLLAHPELNPEAEAISYIHHTGPFQEKFPDCNAVLEGAKYILMERFNEDPELTAKLRTLLHDKGELVAAVVEGKEAEGAKFRDYFDQRDHFQKIPSHRALAMLRGRNEGFLQLKLGVEGEEERHHPCESIIANHNGIQDKGRAGDPWLQEVVRWSWRIKQKVRLELELLAELQQRADTEAIEVFSKNLKDLLLAAPAGQVATIGLDPGLRTGVKVAVIDATGKYLESATIYPHPPRNRWQESLAVLQQLITRHGVKLIAIGNGTASRETDRLCHDLLRNLPELPLQKVMVSEAGASIYSASQRAAEEFPDLDVTIRGAISIARRLQDPLAELVKIEPKSIGVGQYQHDVNQLLLADKLENVVEDCVNSVGVEVNTASVPLLRQVAGLNQSSAENLVNYRDANGPFKSRQGLKKVPRLGARSFEQAAGFLRIHDGDNPLDRSAVHPESYVVVDRIAANNRITVGELIGNGPLLKKINPSDYVDERFGLPTIGDILSELNKPGRDPRPAFQTARLKEGVEKIGDLRPGMILEGTVTNVTNFGAFVDIGVHQDGLVHISALADHFVKDPHQVIKTGEITQVKVLEVDPERKRIALSRRLNDDLPESRRDKVEPHNRQQSRAVAKNSTSTPPSGALATAFANAIDKPKIRS
ncbi:MAG: RNA-binding transcriptional accessory protein [Gammaproteobacteria bacterium]|nr:RNA-binding transcriptional accessory protein [Gammaproteobacteria bacterium]